MFGMITIAGMFESVFSRLIHKLPFMFPAEVTGVVVTMVGISLIPLGVSNFMGIETEGFIEKKNGSVNKSADI